MSHLQYRRHWTFSVLGALALFANVSAVEASGLSQFEGLRLKVINKKTCPGCRNDVVFSGGTMTWIGGARTGTIVYREGANTVPGGVTQYVVVSSNTISFSGIGPTQVLTISRNSCSFTNATCAVLGNAKSVERQAEPGIGNARCDGRFAHENKVHNGKNCLFISNGCGVKVSYRYQHSETRKISFATIKDTTQAMHCSLDPKWRFDFLDYTVVR